ncbi:hypothetical protein ACO2Q3_25465 [Caulobacter sp. KR2-114]|uniref:hypothetical protein n=1 Tax=Caulobacter sp. KR2-114 TaxID=3400912 RepID=UPI003BFD02BC
MHPAITPRRLAGLLGLSGLTGLAGAGVWFEALMRPSVWAASAWGPICGQPHESGLHCPSCYVALAVAAASAGLLAMALDLVRGPSPHRA